MKMQFLLLPFVSSLTLNRALITRNAFERKRQRRGGQRIDVTSRTTYLNSQNEIPGKNQNWNSGNPTYVNRLHTLFSCKLAPRAPSNDGGPRHMKMKASMATWKHPTSED
jgi:hypothetical protein